MGKTLPEFQNFLLSRKLAPENNVPFYAYWVSKFLAFSNNNENLTHDLRVEKFLNYLKAQKTITDWQIRQADEALQLYINHFLDGNRSTLYPNLSQDKKKLPDISSILTEIRQAIRIKHYSYRTERLYMAWAKRFYYYTSNLKKKDIHAGGSV